MAFKDLLRRHELLSILLVALPEFLAAFPEVLEGMLIDRIVQCE